MNNLFQIATWSILIYGVLVLLGGVMGYLKVKIKMSRYSGVGSGVALLVAWFVSLQNPPLGLGIAAAIGVALFGVFVKRFTVTRAFMPAGMMMVFSLAATALFVMGLLGSGVALT